MEVKIGMEYLVDTLHVRQGVAKAISRLQKIAMLCLEAKLKGKNTIEV